VTVALSIAFAAVVGGTVFALIDARFNRGAAPVRAPQPPPRPQYRPQPRTEPLPERVRTEPLDEHRVPSPLWSGWAQD
jgi:hypothetical protein